MIKRKQRQIGAEPHRSISERGRTLYDKEQLNAGDQKRLAELKVELDQYWDLLRQRRTLEEFGENPNKANKRPA